MPPSTDPIARAYATIGLRRGASAKQLKDQYKRLVKIWHPDRWANDPVGQAEAAQRMRAINDAYGVLVQSRPATATKAATVSPPEPPKSQTAQPAASPAAPPRPLSDEELDAIVQAIGNDSMLSDLVNFLVWFAPMVLALVLLFIRRGAGPTAEDWTYSTALFSTGLIVLVIQKLAERRRS